MSRYRTSKPWVTQGEASREIMAQVAVRIEIGLGGNFVDAHVQASSVGIDGGTAHMECIASTLIAMEV